LLGRYNDLGLHARTTRVVGLNPQLPRRKVTRERNAPRHRIVP
jgi:hypothetical protein